MNSSQRRILLVERSDGVWQAEYQRNDLDLVAKAGIVLSVVNAIEGGEK